MSGFSPNALLEEIKTGRFLEDDTDEFPDFLADFLAHGGRINAIDTKSGLTAVEIAITQQDITTADLLLDAGANAARITPDGTTTLMRAIKLDHALNNYESPLLVGKILDRTKSCHINLINTAGDSALSFALSRNMVRTAKILIDHGADVTRTYGPHQMTPLILATQVGAAHLVERILEITEGAEIDATPRLTRTNALGWAVALGHSNIALILINRRANPAIHEGTQNRTPLMLAAQTGHLALAEKILAAPKQLPIDAIDNMKKTALHWAICKRHSDMALLLMDHGANVMILHRIKTTSLIEASEGGLLEVVRKILTVPDALDPDFIDAADSKGATALYWAIREKHSDIALLLMAHGANVMKIPPSFQTTLLIQASKLGLLAVVQRMLTAPGALDPDFIDAVDKEGLTALHQAILEKHAGIALLLMAHNAKVDTTNKLGITPLMEADIEGPKKRLLTPVVEKIKEILSRWSPMRAAWCTGVVRGGLERRRTATLMAPGAAPGAASGIVGGAGAGSSTSTPEL